MNNPKRFEIVLKNNRERNYRKLAFVLVSINLLAFATMLFSKPSRYSGIAGIVSVIIYFIYRQKRYTCQSITDSTDELIFFILAIIWLTQNYVLPLPLILTGILFRMALSPLLFVFTEEGIRKDFFPKRMYDWNDFDSIILKSGVLTMNFKSEHMIQSETIPDPELNEVKFNNYVREKIFTAKDDTINED